MSSPFEQFGPDEAPTANQHPTQVSGVHEAPTQPAPYVEELDEAGALGSIPLEGLHALFEPVVELETGRTIAYEIHTRSRTPGLEAADELFGRAVLEHRVGELGRHMRSLVLDHCGGRPAFLPVHAQELKEGWLIRPDDPLCEHMGEVHVQVAQPGFSSVCRQVLAELCSRPGVSLCLDELGSGVSNLVQLIDLEPTYVKLAPSLIRGIDQDQRRIRTLYRLVQLSGELGATVIAKGLTTASERRIAMRCGVRIGQGPLLGQPAEQPV